jgi:hypothetical protein
MAIDDRVIEAAARELWKTRHGQKEVHPAWNRTLYSAMAEAAVTAALRAMEPEIDLAIGRLIRAAHDVGHNANRRHANGLPMGVDRNVIETEAQARRDLFALLGLDGDA